MAVQPRSLAVGQSQMPEQQLLLLLRVQMVLLKAPQLHLMLLERRYHTRPALAIPMKTLRQA